MLARCPSGGELRVIAILSGVGLEQLVQSPDLTQVTDDHEKVPVFHLRVDVGDLSGVGVPPLSVEVARYGGSSEGNDALSEFRVADEFLCVGARDHANSLACILMYIINHNNSIVNATGE